MLNKAKIYGPTFVQYNAFSSVVKQLFMYMEKLTDISVEYRAIKIFMKRFKKINQYPPKLNVW